ncbi:MAG: chloride channel protein [Pseudomonadota bacterium]
MAIGDQTEDAGPGSAPGSAKPAARAELKRRLRLLAERRFRVLRFQLDRLWGRLAAFDQPKLWLLSLGVGVASGYAAVGFVLGLEVLHGLIFDGAEGTLAAAAAASPLWVVMMAPAFGGLLVGLCLHYACKDAAPLGVADVIEARALGHAKIDPKAGAVSTLSALVSLGCGASAGREGPVVVAGAAISSFVSDRLGLRALDARTMLGCAVAAAVSASFNAPIAGALFALEVVLGHYAVRAFAPITIASVAGAVISRSHLGAEPAFELPVAQFGSYTQFPAFALLGVVAAIASALMMWSVFFARDLIDAWRGRLGLPLWSQPAIAGLALGAIAAVFPEVLAVGYQTTSAALAGALGFWSCVAIAIAKTTAVAITLGGRFAGGVFSPALMLGALTGSAFGAIAIDVFPSVSGTHALYALAGMGACAGAVLGAPISTTLIVFELTRDYGTAIAVMVSTSVATVMTQQLMQKSFFHWQLSRKNIDLSAGPQTFLLPMILTRDLMRPRGAENSASDTAAWDLVEQGVSLRPSDDLAQAFPMFDGGRMTFLPVVESKTEGQGRTLVGALYYVDALRAYNRALVAVHAEEHS